MRHLTVLTCLALLAGCADDLPPWTPLVDLGAGAPPADARPPDDGDTPGADHGDLDGGSATDRGAGDAEALDEGRADGTPPDLAVLDRGPADLDLSDDGLPDDGLPDDGLPDLALPDDGLPDLPDLNPPDVFVPPMEICNGIDDDDNGVIDDAPACGGVISRECRLYLGTLDLWAGNLDPSDEWGNCPAQDTDNNGFLDSRACVGTRRDGTFRRLGMPDNVIMNDNNHFAIALRCDDTRVAQWVQSHCRVYLGQGDNLAGRDADTAATWGPCPGGEGTAGNFKCVSSGGDGRFHPMRILGGVDANDSFAVAFICNDPADPARSEAMQSSAAVAFAWANRNGFAGGNGSGEWLPGCPGPDGTGAIGGDGFGCATSAFDGLFHHFPISENVGDDDAFGIALLPHPEAP